MTRRELSLAPLLLGAAGAEAAPRPAREPLVVNVWPGSGRPPGDPGADGPERVRRPDDAPTRDAKWITRVSVPTLSVFRPPSRRNSGVAVVICPGGGYWNLAWDLEGEEVAARLNRDGVTGIVLKYRVPRRAGEPERLPARGPLHDAQRAMSLVRSRAKEWRIRTDRIGIVGFSAGGHLAIMTATCFDRRSYPPIDELDQVDCRPDFAAAVYPGYLLPEDVETSILAPYIRIPPGTPPIFMVHAFDDPESSPEHSVQMYRALKKAGIPTELHLYADGKHGFGVRKSPLPCSTWPDRFVEWLTSRKLLAGASR